MAIIKNDVVRARIDSQLKQNAEMVLAELGMSMGEAIRLFLTQVSLRHEFPIELKVPNKTTLKAMADKPTDDVYQNVDDLFNEVICDS
ncbi:MAG: type II toxin-antitoxin system RelB/DinJ family antitoxin [Pseudomonadota bacterium]